MENISDYMDHEKNYLLNNKWYGCSIPLCLENIYGTKLQILNFNVRHIKMTLQFIIFLQVLYPSTKIKSGLIHNFNL